MSLSEDYIYHVTSLMRLDEISEEGLLPGSSPTFGASYSGHSAGRVFFTEADGVNFWWERVSQNLETQTDTPGDGWVPVLLRTDLLGMDDTHEDKAGTSDANAEAGYIEEELEPEHLEVWNGKKWIDVEDVKVEKMKKLVMKKADKEVVDGETLVYVDEDMFKPRGN